nr:hypothetical protein [uncultured Rhodopila sp.]
MPDAAALPMVPPGVDPQAYLASLRQQQLAQALQGMALSPAEVQQPSSGVKGIYQQARLSPLSGVSKLVEALLAKKATDTSNQSRAQMMAQALGAFGGGQQAPAAPVDQGPQGGYTGGAGAADAGQPAAPPPPNAGLPGASAPTQGPPAANPLNPFNLPPQVAYALFTQHPDKFAEMAAGTPEWRTALAANGGNVAAAQQQMKAEALKKGLVELRSGGEVGIPDGQGGFHWVRSPNLPPGMDFSRDSSGNPSAAFNIPGLAPALAQQHQAVAQGTAQGSIHEFQTPGGGSTYSFGLPPGLPGAPRNYFGPGAGLSGTGAAPPGSGPQTGPASSGAGHVVTQAPPTPAGVTPGIWKGAPVRPNPSGLGEDPYQKELVAGMAKKNDELSDKYGSEADLADQRIAFNNEALKVLNSSETGPLSAALLKLGAKASELGVSVPWIPDAKTVNDSAELKKFLLRNPLLSLKPTFGGRPAASEFQILANDASPSPEMLKGAISRLVQLDNQAAGFSKQRSTDYGYYHDQLQGNPQRFESWYANRVPFAKWLDTHPAAQFGPAAAAPAGKATPIATATVNGKTAHKYADGHWETAD